MRCSICHKPFFHNISFKNLFYFNFICPSCVQYLKPKKLSIPIDDGYLLNYYYFTEDETIERELTLRLFNAIKGIIKENYNSLILFLDDDTLPFINYFRFKENITLISIVFEDLEYILSSD